MKMWNHWVLDRYYQLENYHAITNKTKTQKNPKNQTTKKLPQKQINKKNPNTPPPQKREYLALKCKGEK